MVAWRSATHETWKDDCTKVYESLAIEAYIYDTTVAVFRRWNDSKLLLNSDTIPVFD